MTATRPKPRRRFTIGDQLALFAPSASVASTPPQSNEAEREAARPHRRSSDDAVAILCEWEAIDALLSSLDRAQLDREAEHALAILPDRIAEIERRKGIDSSRLLRAMVFEKLTAVETATKDVYWWEKL